MKRFGLSGLCVALGLTLALVVTGCSTKGNDDAPVGPVQITGIALPDGYSINNSRTIVLGEGDRWTGRLSYTIGSSPSDMFDFYRRQMPSYGWTEIAVVRAENSVLTFSSPNTGRVATVQIGPRMVYGSSVDVVIAQQAGAGSSAPARPGGAGLSGESPIQGAPRDGVSAQPLQPLR